jgi:fructosamine-3-kinase
VNLFLGWTIVGWIGVLLFPVFWKDQWKVKWNERYVSRKKKKKEHRSVNDHLQYHDEIDNFVKRKRQF